MVMTMVILVFMHVIMGDQYQGGSGHRCHDRFVHPLNKYLVRKVTGSSL